jgi:hypothetical protein
MSCCSGVSWGSNTAKCSINSSSSHWRIAASGVSNLFSLMVLPSEGSTNDEDEDAGGTGIADDAGGESEH